MFSKMLNTLSRQPDAHAAVRAMLQAAQRTRTKIALELRSSGQPAVLTSTIEQVRDQDLVVGQPTLGGMTYPLAFDEAMKLSFVSDMTYHTGQTRCLGRVKIPAGTTGHMIFAYALAIPERLQAEDRRVAPRVSLDFENAPEAQLYSPALTGPVLGHIVDISMTGARIRTSLAAGKIIRGQEIFLKAILSEPVGLVDEMVEVARVEIDPQSGEHLIGISFRKKIDGLDLLLRRA